GGFGGYDLWIARWNHGKKEWDTPTNLGPQINTAFDEKSPYQRNSTTLYFSSNQVMGMGGYDIYCAKKNVDNNRFDVENMKYPINSAQDELGIIFEKNTETGYLSSNREGGKGSFDIWRFHVK
ncbi:MAG: hypothetical protein IAF38_11890, partial [Bacteroidia bacterium]|nr:hypothetical protein [Bacteroidia bacterium]